MSGLPSNEGSLMGSFAPQAYDSKDVNGPLLLADIPIRRTGGPLSAARKVGAELSKKIHELYTNKNPDFIL